MNFTAATFALGNLRLHALACIRVVLHQHICRGHKNLFYRKYSVGKRNVRLMNNVKRENVRESRILNSCECSDLPNLNIA